MFALVKSGGPLMVPIILCGVAATFIIIERLYFFITVRRREAALVPGVLDALSSADYAAADGCCREGGTPCADVLHTALSCRAMDEAHRRELVQCELDAAAARYGRLVPALSLLANVATLLGLLGTVTGNIKAFNVLGGGGSMGNPALLASSIAEALVTTVGGLCVAVPSLVFHGVLREVASRRVAAMERAVTQVLARLAGQEPVQ